MRNDAVTGHDDGNRIRSQRHANSPGILFPTHAHGDPLIGSHAPVGDPFDRLPHLSLKRGAARPIKRQRKISTVAVEIGQELGLRFFHNGRSGIIAQRLMMRSASRGQQVDGCHAFGRSRDGDPAPSCLERARLCHVRAPRIFARPARVCA